MFVLDFVVADAESMRPLLLILLVLAILFLLAGAIIAIFALCKQRKSAVGGITLKQLENEAG